MSAKTGKYGEVEKKKRKRMKPGQKEQDDLDKFQQVDNIGRKKWDLSKYKEDALKKIADGEEDAIYAVGLVDDSQRWRASQPLARKDELLAVVPTEPLRKRETKVDVFKNVGQYQVVTNNTALAQRGGWYCDVCECLLKDSNTYLDHINGKKHQRRLGMTMRPERATLADVRAKLKQRKQGEGGGEGGEKSLSELSVEERLQYFDEQERNRKKQKKERRKMLEEEKADKLARGEDVDEEDNDGTDNLGETEKKDDAEGVGAEGELTEEEMMAKMMGFGSFTGTI